MKAWGIVQSTSPFGISSIRNDGERSSIRCRIWPQEVFPEKRWRQSSNVMGYFLRHDIWQRIQEKWTTWISITVVESQVHSLNIIANSRICSCRRRRTNPHPPGLQWESFLLHPRKYRE